MRKRRAPPEVAVLAQPTDSISSPQDWDKAVSAAYLRMIGQSQIESAEGAGVGRRTLQDWEKCSWWEAARAEARGRWLQGLVDRSRATVYRAADSDVALAERVLERMDADFKPIAQEINVRGILGIVQALPPNEVARLAALPPEERKAHLQFLAGAA